MRESGIPTASPSLLLVSFAGGGGGTNDGVDERERVREGVDDRELVLVGEGLLEGDVDAIGSPRQRQ
jgi:hypothetical protein